MNIGDERRVLIYGITDDIAKLATRLLEKKCRVLIATDSDHSIEFRRRTGYYCRVNRIHQKSTSTITLPERIRSNDEWPRRLYNHHFDALCLLPPDKGITSSEELKRFWGDPNSGQVSPGVRHMADFTATVVAKMKQFSPIFFLNWSIRAADTFRPNKERFLSELAKLGYVRAQDIVVTSLKVDQKALKKGSVTSRLGKLVRMSRIDLNVQTEFDYKYVR